MSFKSTHLCGELDFASIFIFNVLFFSGKCQLEYLNELRKTKIDYQGKVGSFELYSKITNRKCNYGYLCLRNCNSDII